MIERRVSGRHHGAGAERSTAGRVRRGGFAAALAAVVTTLTAVKATLAGAAPATAAKPPVVSIQAAYCDIGA